MLQTLEKTRVLGLKPDRDAKVIRHPIGADRPNDNACLEEALKHVCRARHLERDEIAKRRNVFEAKRARPSVICFMPARLSSFVFVMNAVSSSAAAAAASARLFTLKGSRTRFIRSATASGATNAHSRCEARQTVTLENVRVMTRFG